MGFGEKMFLKIRWVREKLCLKDEQWSDRMWVQGNDGAREKIALKEKMCP
jgi:hypothetical protein